MPPTNILLITSDQQHWRTLGKINPTIKTPNLDRLCDEGTRFTRAYCNNPVCSPSRSTIITGMYPSWHGCWTIGCKLPEDVPTISDYLQTIGYDCSLIGKAHFQPLRSEPSCESLECHPKLRDLDFWRNFHGPFYGFNHIEIARNHADEYHAGQHYALWMEEKGLKNWRDYFQIPDYEHLAAGLAPRDPEKPDASGRGDRYWEQGRRHQWNLPEEFHYTTWTAERSIARIDKCASENQPFFLWTSFHDPHPPYLVPEPWASMYKPEDMELPPRVTKDELALLAPHFAETQKESGDFSIFNETQWPNHGLHSHLFDEHELKKDLAIYYGMISFMDAQIGRILDRLDQLGLTESTLVVFTSDHGHFIGEHGLIAKGPFHYEDLLRLPFIARWPRKIPAGHVNNSLQALIDLSPTFLDAISQKIPGQMQGISQLKNWTGQSPTSRDHVIAENRHQPTKLDLRTFITKDWKLTLYRGHGFGELFDLKSDPHETRNLWSNPQYKDIKLTLMHQFLDAEMQREPTRMQRIAGA